MCVGDRGSEKSQCSPRKVVPVLSCWSWAALGVEQGSEGSSSTKSVLSVLTGMGDVIRCDGDSGYCQGRRWQVA